MSGCELWPAGTARHVHQMCGSKFSLEGLRPEQLQL